jgi:ElaB/YqjD/DUF883 family membrane-anchored ribosome-binding protein
MISTERVGTEIGLMTGRIRKTFRNSKHNLSSLQTNISERTRRAARKTDYYVHDNAWIMMAFSAGLAFAAGFLLSRGNQNAIVHTLGEIPDADKKVKKVNSWEFLHSSIPLALFVWKAYMASRDQRRADIWEG